MADLAAADVFNPNAVDLDTADPTQIICYLNAGGNEYDGRLGTRISALFVIFVLSTCATMLPIAADRIKWLRMPLWLYLFARYFGAGVIIATAFIHLLDPAYSEIGPNTCVGMTGGWAEYSWVPAIVMTSVMLLFLLEFGSQLYVEHKYGVAAHVHGDAEAIVTGAHHHTPGDDAVPDGVLNGHHAHHNHSHAEPDAIANTGSTIANTGSTIAPTTAASDKKLPFSDAESFSDASTVTERSFREQIAAFLILEFGVIFHSVIIGLNLATAGDEFGQLYPVLVFHQSFEGLGIGARLSVIPFPQRLKSMPWLLCLAYGLTTPIAIAVGLGIRTTYDAGSFTANVVSGLLDSISAGILIYTGLVELLAREFLFNPERTRDKKRIAFMLTSLFLGALLMALLGKWA